jgi:hypothetical protein
VFLRLAALRKHQLAPIPSGPFSANQVKTSYVLFSSLWRAVKGVDAPLPPAVRRAIAFRSMMGPAFRR